MDHVSTTSPFAPTSYGAVPPDRPAAEGPTQAERQARANWLVTELGRLAANAEDPHDQARFRRTADSLVRLATAFRS